MSLLISGALDLTGSLNITGSTTQIGNNTLLGNTLLSGSIGIVGNSTLTGSFLVSGSTTQIGNNTLLGNTILDGTIQIVGNSTLTGSFLVSGSTTQLGNNTMIGNTLLSGSVGVSGSLAVVGSFTSSLAEGYTLVGGAGNVSKLVATSSFGVAGGSTDITLLNQFSGSINTYTSSNDLVRNRILQTTASLNTYTGSNDSVIVRILQTTASLNATTGSLIGITNGLMAYTSSVIPRILQTTASLNSKTGSYATTGSNQFNGSQQITGSLSVSSNLTVSSTLVNDGAMALTNGSNLTIGTGSFLIVSSSQFVSGSIIVTGSINTTMGIKVNSVEYSSSLYQSSSISGSVIEFNKGNNITQTVTIPKGLGYSGLGWARYDDTTYTTSSAFTIINGSVVTIPCNGSGSIETHMHSLIPFFNPTVQKIQAENDGDVYVITLNFSMKSATTPADGDYVRLAMTNTVGTSYTRVGRDLFFAKKDTNWHKYHEVFQYYSDTDFVANGNEFNIIPDGVDIQIADVILFIQRTQNHSQH